MEGDHKHRYRKRDRVLQLWTFRRAAELGSLSRAAKSLSIEPKVVSLHVRELEHEVNAALFDRGMQGVTLTPAGECLHELVSPLLERLGALADHLEDPELASARLHLHVISGGGVTGRIASRVLRRLRGEHPKIDLRVQTSSHDEVLRRLLAHEASLAFGAARHVPDEIIFRPLLSSRWVMITPPAHPLAKRETMTLEEFGPWPTIAPTLRYLSREPEGDETPYRHPEFQRNVAVETDGWPAALAFVETGAGITIADALAIPKDARVASVPLANRLPIRTFGLFHRSHGSEPRFLRRFVEAARAEFADASTESASEDGFKIQPDPAIEENYRTVIPPRIPPGRTSDGSESSVSPRGIEASAGQPSRPLPVSPTRRSGYASSKQSLAPSSLRETRGVSFRLRPANASIGSPCLSYANWIGCRRASPNVSAEKSSVASASGPDRLPQRRYCPGISGGSGKLVRTLRSA